MDCLESLPAREVGGGVEQPGAHSLPSHGRVDGNAFDSQVTRSHRLLEQHRLAETNPPEHPAKPVDELRKAQSQEGLVTVLQADKARQFVFKDSGEGLLRVDTASDKCHSLLVEPQNATRLSAKSVEIQLRRVLEMGGV